jgi:hypothetical protein
MALSCKAYNDMDETEKLAIQHKICDFAKDNDFKMVEKLLNLYEAPELLTARPNGRHFLGQQAMFHNNIDAIEMLQEYDRVAFYKAWADPLNAKSKAELALKTSLSASDKKQAETIIASTPTTINDTMNEKHVAKETIIAFLSKPVSFDAQGNPVVEAPESKKRKLAA